LDAVTLVDGKMRHAPHGVRTDVDGIVRLDLARRRHDRSQVARLDGFDVDGRAFLTFVLEVDEHDRPQDHHDPGADQDFLVPTHYAPRLLKAAMAIAITPYTDNSVMAIGCVRRRYSTASPIARTISHQIRNRSIAPRKFATNDFSGSIGSRPPRFV